MRLKSLGAIVALAISASAQAMPVDVFLTKSAALQAQGFTAMFSSDVKLLTNAMKADAAALKAERDAAKLAGRAPAYCPPAALKMSSNEIIEAMRTVPVPARAMTDSRDVLRAYFARRFPCAA